MTGNKRRQALAWALAGTVVAAWFAPSPSQDDVVVALPTRMRAVVSAAGSSASVAAPQERAAAKPLARVREIHPREGGADLLQGDAMGAGAATDSPPPAPQEPRPPQKSKPAPPPPPPQAEVAPALPFTVLGRYGDGQSNAVFLRFQERDLVVRTGDNFADHYKVESLDRSTLTLRYLPLNQLQQLDLSPFETKE